MNGACNESEPRQHPSTPNEVLVLGAIHGRHSTSEMYGCAQLESIIRAVAPDVILSEIPPDRFPAAVREFQEHDSISEPRVARFPEYVDVVFPLSKELPFEIIPTAGWTRAMADARSARLDAISNDSSRSDEWREYLAAGERADSAIKAGGADDDPFWIHSDAYDEAIEIWAATYNRLFNEELGPGGWDNINKAHYGHIIAALDRYEGQGKRMLIIYGAAHKGWFLRKLRQRKDIELLNLKPFLVQALKP